MGFSFKLTNGSTSFTQSANSNTLSETLLSCDWLKLALPLVNLKLKQLSSQGTYRKKFSMIQRTTLYVEKFKGVPNMIFVKVICFVNVRECFYTFI